MGIYYRITMGIEYNYTYPVENILVVPLSLDGI